MKIRIVVTGKVQGVGFRFAALRKAEELGLKASAANVDYDKVEINAEGDEENLKQLAEWSSIGPKFAKVDKIEVKWI